ncbi:tyrosine-protein phosphatase [Phytomonospora sp. NPDC050363]|uniref:tyrosine-protein phosphatase n=1 Tax=Phytomonospora sp. NPDC050363 TaxID=3155642 RepID=UPI0033C9D009
MARHIPLEGSPNVRDLGGYATADGRTLVEGRLYRAGSLNALTDDDLAAVTALKLATVVDFRTPGEIQGAGADRLPDGLTATLLPIGGGDLDQYYNAAFDPEERARLLEGGRNAEALVGINRGFVSSATEREQFAEALRLIADAESLPMLFHCTAGKDRTGWLSAILLTALGVDRETVTADYMLSNEYFLPGGEELLAKLAGSGLDIDADLFRPLIEQRPAYLEAAFAEADERFGSFDGFLHKGLDLDDDTLDALRAALLD